MRILIAIVLALSIILFGLGANYARKAAQAAAQTEELLLAASKNLEEIALKASVPATEEFDASHIARARLWFIDNGFDVADLLNLPDSERARMVTVLTYRFCKTGNETPRDLNELYGYCSTQCGGYAYVARGLAEVLGLRTRYANLYNIPQQGNHVAVELLVNGVWEFYDPTFGAFFTEDGAPEGRVLNLSQIAGQEEGGLESKVVQADKTAGLSKPPGYSGNFEHQYMEVENYRSPEAIVQFLPGEMLLLRVPVASTEAIGPAGETDRAQLVAGWLAYTNATLNDSDPENDTSFSSYLLLNRPIQRATALDISGLSPGRHVVAVTLHNPGAPQRLQVSPLGKPTRLLSERIVTLPGGSHVIDIAFATVSSDATIFLRNMDAGVLELYAYDLDINTEVATVE